MNMPQAGLCDKKLSLVENRNHVWRDLSRLVDVECKNCHVVDSISFLGKKCEHASSWQETVVGGEQERFVEGSLQVS